VALLLATLELSQGADTVRLGLLKAVPETWDLEANFRTFLGLIDVASERKVELLVTPEGWLDGYAAAAKGSTPERLRALAQDLDRSPYLERVAAEARSRSMAILFCFTSLEGGKIHNAAGLWGPDGKRIGVYHKTHLQSHDLQFAPGEALPTFPTPWGPVGIMICADRRWPETARTLRLKGARLILNPSYGMHHLANEWWMRTRGYENQCFIAFAHPEVGFVVDPQGDLAAKLEEDPPGILVTDVDLARARDDNHIRDRRPELYSVIAATPGPLSAVGSAPAAETPPQERTWVEIEGEAYGAQADEQGPIGGGAGYQRIVAGGDHVAGDLDGLLEALGKAKAGETVFIPAETEIDCTARVHIEGLVIEVPAGVTLAGNRGAGGSAGALISSDALKTPVLIRAMGPGVRVTGLRIRGPNPKRYLDHHKRSFAEGRGHEYYYKLPTSDGIVTDHPGLEVDNCEISAFAHAGVCLVKGEGHRIHHSSIHHCQYAGLGYGISHGAASSLIERNLFDSNRHSIAGTGVPGCGYEARHNVEAGTALSHSFDMHGGRDRKDGTDVAGTRILIHHNTFRAPETPVVIRGVPEETCTIHHNWFPRHAAPAGAVEASGNTLIEANAYGEDAPKVIR
jgi:predicted amidohydrolase